MAVLTSITRIFATYGQPVVLETAGVTRTVTGFVLPMDGATTGVYFDGNEAVGLLKPAFVLYVAGSEPSPPGPNDTFSYADLGPGGTRLLAVRKVQAFRIANVVVLWVGLCD